MYVKELDKAGSTPVARFVVTEQEREILLAAFEARFGASVATLDDRDLTSIFDARRGFLWTVLTSGGAPLAFCRQPSFAMRPKWTFVPVDEVEDDIRARFFA